MTPKATSARKKHAKFWIKDAINPAHKGLLHKELKVPMGQKIPASKLASAAAHGTGVIGKRARLAQTLRRMNSA